MQICCLSLKKAIHDHEVQLKNVSLISKLTFVSKFTEKAIGVQMIDYICEANWYEMFQFACKQFHKTEIALLWIQNDQPYA